VNARTAGPTDTVTNDATGGTSAGSGIKYSPESKRESITRIEVLVGSGGLNEVAHQASTTTWAGSCRVSCTVLFVVSYATPVPSAAVDVTPSTWAAMRPAIPASPCTKVTWPLTLEISSLRCCLV
jgi:hypothetical protein